MERNTLSWATDRGGPMLVGSRTGMSVSAQRMDWVCLSLDEESKMRLGMAAFICKYLGVKLTGVSILDMSNVSQWSNRALSDAQAEITPGFFYE